MSQTWDIDLINPSTTTPATDIQRIIDGFNALRSVHIGASDPADTTAGMLAINTTSGLVKQRNSADTGWNTVGEFDVANWGLLSRTLYDAKGDIITASADNTPVRKAAGADGSVLQTDSSQSDGLLWVPNLPLSLAPNAFMGINQRGNSSITNADDTYSVCDRWYVLTETASIQTSPTGSPEAGQKQALKLTQNQASAQRMGVASILEGLECKYLHGKTVTFRPRVRISSSQTVRFAILEWTSSEDSVTSDCVLNWASASYTAGGFFNASGFNIVGTTNFTPSANTWTDAPALTVTLGTTFNNILLFVWTEAQAASGLTLEFGRMRFVPGAYAGEILLPSRTTQFNQCVRHFWKSFNETTIPAQNNGLNSGELTWVSNKGASTQGVSPRFLFPVHMRAIPTLTFYNPAAANAQARDKTAVQDCSSTTSANLSDGGFNIVTTNGAAGAVGNELGVHVTASADL